MRTFASFVLVVFGFFAAFWGGVCLLGGPDAMFLSRDSFIWGGVALLLAGLLITVSRIVVHTGPFLYAPMFVSVVAWTVGITISQHAGAYVCVLGVPSSAVVCIVYWFISVVCASKSVGH
ncbi:MAG: hypothetical protein ABSC38_03525 [Verrucomicrobiia bacterium]